MLVRNADLAVFVDSKCSPEGCWYCHHHCHSGMNPWPASVMYMMLSHVYRQHSGVYTILDVKAGEIQDVPVHGAHLLLSDTV